MTMLVQTMIFPVIDFSDVCYLDLNADLNILHRFLNNCVRFIFNSRKFDHVSAYRTQLSWLPIRECRSLQVMLLHSSFILDHPSGKSLICPLLRF